MVLMSLQVSYTGADGLGIPIRQLAPGEKFGSVPIQIALWPLFLTFTFNQDRKLGDKLDIYVVYTLLYFMM